MKESNRLDLILENFESRIPIKIKDVYSEVLINMDLQSKERIESLESASKRFISQSPTKVSKQIEKSIKQTFKRFIIESLPRRIAVFFNKLINEVKKVLNSSFGIGLFSRPKPFFEPKKDLQKGESKNQEKTRQSKQEKVNSTKDKVSSNEIKGGHYFPIPKEIWKLKIPKEDVQKLKEGEAILIKGIELKGEKINALFQLNRELKTLEWNPISMKLQMELMTQKMSRQLEVLEGEIDQLSEDTKSFGNEIRNEKQKKIEGKESQKISNDMSINNDNKKDSGFGISF